MNKVRVFIDVSGTLFQIDSTYQKESMIPEMNVIQGMKKLIRKNVSFEFYTIDYHSQKEASSVNETHLFLDKYIPIPKENRLFIPKREDREKYIPHGIQQKDVLIDDSASSLKDWQYKGGIGIQILNGKNNNDGWIGARIDCRLDAVLFAYQLQYFIVSAVQDEYEFERMW